MATETQIRINARKLRERGAPESTVQRYIELAKKEKTGGDIAKEVLSAPVRALATPFALFSEDVRSLTGTTQSGIEKKLSDFALQGTERDSRERVGAIVESAADAASFLPLGQATTLKSAVGSGMKIGAGFGGVYGGAEALQEGEGVQGIVSNALLGMVAGGTLGGVLSGGLYGVGKAPSFVSNKLRRATEKVGQSDNVVKDVLKFKNKAKEYSKLLTNRTWKQRVYDDIATLQLDINPTLYQKLTQEGAGGESIRREVKKGIVSLSKSSADEQQHALYNEMRDALLQLKNNVGAEFGEIKKRVINKYGNVNFQEATGDSLQDLFLHGLRKFDNEAQIKDGKIVFSALSDLSVPDKNAIQKIFQEEVASRTSTVLDLLNTSSILDRGLAYDQSVTDKVVNLRKLIAGSIDERLNSFIDDPDWIRINDEYRAFAELESAMMGIVDNLKGEADARKIDAILTQLGTTYRKDKAGRKSIITRLEQATGKNFHDALIANEIIRDLTRRKGIASGQNVGTAITRVLDPGKYSVLTSILDPEIPQQATQKVISPAGKAYDVVKNKAKNIQKTIDMLMVFASDPDTPKGLRALFLIMAKELMFPISDPNTPTNVNVEPPQQQLQDIPQM